MNNNYNKSKKCKGKELFQLVAVEKEGKGDQEEI